MDEDNRGRIILHVDMNSFYANVECLFHPELRDKPVAVGGDVEARHGIILAKNRLAKSFGVKTAETLWQARQKCPELVILKPDYPLYLRFSRLARAIYYDYSDLVEPFGPDEAWIDCTGTVGLFGGDPLLIAAEISERVKAELGVTVSIGVSWNKIFAKFGSDYDGGDGIVSITPDNYREMVWPAPVEDLLYVGHATQGKLNDMGILTIGDLAVAPPKLLRKRLGKVGEILGIFANGADITPVKVYDPANASVDYDIKSIGNGLTAPHDLVGVSDTKTLVYALGESVAQRLRECHLKANTICIYVRDARTLYGYTRQHRLPRPTDITHEVVECAWALLEANEPLDGSHPLRSLGVRAAELVCADVTVQTDLFTDEERRKLYEDLDHAIDDLRRRFGNTVVRHGTTMADADLASLDIKRDNVVHPVGFFAS